MNKIVFLLVLVLGASVGFWYFGKPGARTEGGASDTSSVGSSETNPAKSAAHEMRTKANTLIEKCRRLDDSDRGVRRRVATCESQLSLADAFFAAGNYDTAREAYEVVIVGCEKALKAGEDVIEEAKAMLRQKYLESERAALKRMPMPGKDEIEASEMLVKAAIRDGADAGDLMSKAEYVEFGSERYAFLMAAFAQFVKDGDGAGASEAARALMDGFEKPDYVAIVSLIENEAKALIDADDNDIKTALKLARLRVAADELRKEARKTLKKNPDDIALRQRVAEALVILGEWEAARKQFAKLEGTGYAAAFVDEENDDRLFAAAEFWWNCEQKGELNVKPFYRNRAISLYKQMIGKNKGSEDEKAVAEKRLAERLLGK